MSETMHLLSLPQLFSTLADEYRAHRSIFGIHENSWYRPATARTVRVNRETCALPLGPAAGPHTQLAQNIVSAYLTGSRYFELKTVQILDALEIDKPCIDAADEGYNTEWSTELSLEAAWGEYARAWIALHAIEELFGLGGPSGTGHEAAGRGDGADRAPDSTRSFIFAMSVGYDLAGITSPRVAQYLDRMTDSAAQPDFQAWLDELDTLVPRLAGRLGIEPDPGAAKRVRERAAAPICTSVTLSTMHGCPPREIESICRHMIEERRLDTLVKLNPTLLGYDTVRRILDGLGWEYVTLSREGFAHDLSYEPAIEILTRLRQAAAEVGRSFGVKLSNTLATVNDRDALPGEDMYLSGRALFPIAITLAARLAAEFEGRLPISYCGGITAHNARSVLAAGIRPLTLSTELLKPGGYTRQLQIAREIESVDEWERATVDAAALETIAESARGDERYHKRYRGTDKVAVAGVLPVTDCYRAPCVEACPIGQHVPEYIRLLGEGRYADALALIYERNALPAITGHICDHQCRHACTRLDYEGAISIRELKKIAVEQGGEEYRARVRAPKVTRAEQCAVIGAGPAGLAAAYFLARAGFAVTVFERERNAGGVVRNVIPEFRLPVAAIETDIEHIKSMGVRFEFGSSADLTADRLRERGYGPIVLAIGAEVGNELSIDGDRSRIVRSLDFLWGFRGNRENTDIGPRVAVVGGGNTAMDAARAAMTLNQVTHVDVLYRRSEAEMPADREEYEAARADGVVFHFLSNPESINPDGSVTVRAMRLGEPDAGGRRRPAPTDRTEKLAADTLITAIGERVDDGALRRFGVPMNETGGPVVNRATLETAAADVFLAGDAESGPSTVVRCIAAGRTAARAISARYPAAGARAEAHATSDSAAGASTHPPAGAAAPLLNVPFDTRLGQLRARARTVGSRPSSSAGTDPAAFARSEYARCLECSYVCNKCVDVCPNRANITVPTVGEELFSDPFQIVHLDAYCNECGNCGHFCPWTERVPYRDKPTVFTSRAAFEQSTNDGWSLDGKAVLVRRGGAVTRARLENGRIARDGAHDRTDTDARMDRLFELLYRDRPSLFGALETSR